MLNISKCYQNNVNDRHRCEKSKYPENSQKNQLLCHNLDEIR